MQRESGGVFSVTARDVGPGALYRFGLDDRELPDPYARFLPEGVHGPAEVMRLPRGPRPRPPARPLREHVVYELHVGTFTPEGNYAAAAQRLPELAELGITTLELMPLSSFAGARGWGYDGVAHFAPHAAYGRPEELCAFLDRAHELGLHVLLDVVYNHFGPAGNYLRAYSPDYFSSELQNAWGDAPDFVHAPMRRYVLDNALYWLDEVGFDGLRLDATHAIIDPSPRHILAELADRVAALDSGERLLMAEDDRNDPALVARDGLDAIWADDFHHCVRVTLTGERDGYYAAYPAGAAAIAETIENGWLYRGQNYPLRDEPRGHDASGVPREAFVYCIQNHDQVGNRAFGDRLQANISLDAYCAASTLLLFLPMTPLLFMGQEWACSAPFMFFTDHEADLGRAVARGRREEFKRFAAFADPDRRATIPDPQALETFTQSKLDWSERAAPNHARVVELYRALLALRRTHPALALAQGQVLRASAPHESVVAIERQSAQGRLRLWVNLGADPIDLRALGVAPQAQVLLRSSGTGPLEDTLPGQIAVILEG
jgi:maltooligosyltrehalose trehalohydrolase